MKENVPKKNRKGHKFLSVLLIITLGVTICGHSHSVVAQTYTDGIDVSHWQGSINWSQVYGGGYRFAFIKASEGTSYTDSKFTTNMSGALSAGLYPGPYHFAHPDSYSATAEAAHFVDVAGDYMTNGYLRPALDLEDGASLSTTALTDWVIDFMTYVENETGVEPVIYCNSNYANNELDSRVTQYDLWIAHWDVSSPNTGVWDSWEFWQYHVADYGEVPGISERCDQDYFNGDLNTLKERHVIGYSGGCDCCGSCPQHGGSCYNGHEYKLITTTKTWADAKNDCLDRGGHLVSITSSGENDFVDQLIGSNCVWIGLTDEDTEGTWEWVTGEDYSYNNWSTYEPNNCCGGEDYGEMCSDGYWNDNGGPRDPNLTRYYVCEWGSHGGTMFNGHEYKLCETEKTWADAKNDCMACHGHLVTITSSAENDFVSNLAGSNSVWIGLTDEDTEGTWTWVTGESVVYTNWNSGEPNNYGSGEDYGEMISNGTWNDNGPPQFPSTTRYYVCEWQYEFIETKKSWADAKADCEARGGHLVTITSSAENDFVSNLAGSNTIWIGLTDEATEGTWLWVTGESVVYTNWNSGEPNNYGSGEDYGEMTSNGTWNDNGPPQFPNETRYYICEYD
ncbi:MAG: lectin-like protein [Candidatus Methanofastidiosia archaeon]